jgi:UDP-glucose 4-epimerase
VGKGTRRSTRIVEDCRKILVLEWFLLMTLGEANMERVLVTGGAGFIGSHLVDELVDCGTQKVIVLDNLSSGHIENIRRCRSVQFVQGDISNIVLVERLVKKVDTVFHLAEYIPETKKYGPGHVIKYSSENPLGDFDVNTRGTLIVLNAARRYKRKLIFASTAAVYGNAGLKTISEDCKPEPLSPYGAAKLSAEIYVNLFFRQYNVPTVVVRFFNVYGPRQRKYVMYDLLSKILSRPRSLEVLGSGKRERDFIFVQDAVNALLLLATRPEAQGDVFNVGTGKATLISKIAELLLQILDIDLKIRYSGSSWTGDLDSIVADTRRINSLGFRPKFSLEEGLERLVSWALASQKI